MSEERLIQLLPALDDSTGYDLAIMEVRFSIILFFSLLFLFIWSLSLSTYVVDFCVFDQIVRS